MKNHNNFSLNHFNLKLIDFEHEIDFLKPHFITHTAQFLNQTHKLASQTNQKTNAISKNSFPETEHKNETGIIEIYIKVV